MSPAASRPMAGEEADGAPGGERGCAAFRRQDALLRDAERFVFREARLADAHDYDAWEALWTDDAIYWVPGEDADADPRGRMSIIYDNRSRIATRIKQLKTGKRFAQTPASRLRRLITNVELLGRDGGDLLVGASCMVGESRERGTTLWIGDVQWRLRETPDGLRMAAKKVVLIDHDQELPTLGFLL